MLKKILIGLAGVVALLAVALGVLAIVVALQLSEFHVERSLAMSAPPEAVFEQVNDFHKWEAWSPWLKVDPNAKRIYEGPSSGEGAIFRWIGNEEVGEGSMTILESKPLELIRIKLHFVKPFEGDATSDFTFTPAGKETQVTWAMDGKNNFVSKAVCLLLMDMDDMIGSKYEEGLARIKTIVESAPQVPNNESPSPTTVSER